MSDPLIDLLAGLPTAEPDAESAERTRTRCRARLARERRSSSPAIRAAHLWQLVALLGVVYLIDAVIEAVSLYH